MVTRRQYRTEDEQILGVTVQNLGAGATWRPGFVYPCHTLLSKARNPRRTRSELLKNSTIRARSAGCVRDGTALFSFLS